MNKTLKKNYLLIPLASILIMLGCQVEKQTMHSEQKAFIAKSISYNQFIKETQLSNFDTSITIPPRSIDIQGRTIDGKYELNDFEIDTDVIKSMEFQQKKTYSLKIHPKVNDSQNYFNLIMYKKDNVWEKTIVEMKPTSENLYKLQNGLTDQFECKMRTLYNSVPPVINTAGCQTITFTIQNCIGCEGACDQCNICFSVVTYNSCDIAGTTPNDSGGGSGSGPLDNNWGGGEGVPSDVSSLNPDDIVAEPNLDDNSISSVNDNPNAPKTPCKELNKLTSLATSKTALNDLKTKTGETIENGYYLTKNPLTGTLSSPTKCQANPTKPNEIIIPTGAAYVGAFHTHPTDGDGWVRMFSDGDIYYLFMVAVRHNNYGQPKDYSDYFLTLTVPDGTFAIKIKDWTKFATAMNNKKEWDVNHHLNTLNSKYDRRSATDNIKGFKKDLLDVFQKLDMGAGLYEANADFSGWTEVTLNPNATFFNDDPINIPCN